MEIQFAGDELVVAEFAGLVDEFDPIFTIVTLTSGRAASGGSSRPPHHRGR